MCGWGRNWKRGRGRSRARLLRVLLLEREAAGEQHVQHHAERPHVQLGPVVLARLERLGRAVRRGREAAREGPPHRAAHGPVDDLDAAPVAALQHDVLEAEVPVADALAMRVAQRRARLPHDLLRLLVRAADVHHELGERHALHKLEHEQHPLLRVEALVQLADVRVAELRVLLERRPEQPPIHLAAVNGLDDHGLVRQLVNAQHELGADGGAVDHLPAVVQVDHPRHPGPAVL